MASRAGTLWVLGYGSLMWNPGFAFASQSIARLNGYHRALCIYSTHYRGTLARPGLVFGLDRGGVCDGVAFEVAADSAGAVLAALRQRELIYGVYREARVPVTLLTPEPRTIDAITYIAERAHPNFAGSVDAARQACIIRGAKGRSGTNLAYVINTLKHMQTLGLRDRTIERIGQMSSAFARRAELTDNGEAARITSLSTAWRHGRGAGSALRPADQSRFQHRAALGRIAPPL